MRLILRGGVVSLKLSLDLGSPRGGQEGDGT
jgi:hypothetical protein